MQRGAAPDNLFGLKTKEREGEVHRGSGGGLPFVRIVQWRRGSALFRNKKRPVFPVSVCKTGNSLPLLSLKSMNKRTSKGVTIDQKF